MSSNSQKPLVFEYKKRRFDGGSEIEIIQQIENQYRIYEQQVAAGLLQPVGMQAHAAVAHHAMPVPMAPQVQQPYSVAPEQVAPQPEPKTLQSVLHKAFVVPYVELILGLSGILVGYIMVLTLIKGASQSVDVLKSQREALIKESWSVIRSSVNNILAAPVNALRLSVQP